MLNSKATTGESLVEQEKKRQDLGFGTKVTDNQTRMIRPDGNFNVRRVGQPFMAWFNSYHRLITMHWLPFIGVIFFSYFLVNLLFAFAYFAIGSENFNGLDASGMSPFWGAFFFSSQTLTTVGYGHISPVGGLASSVAAVEALLGLMMFAIITGLLYGRFSRPNPQILFSDNAIIAPYLDINGFMFRMANQKSNQLINLNVSVIFSRNEPSTSGFMRKYYTLELERSMVKFFPMSWTVVHPITEESPLFGLSETELKASDAEFLIAIEGVNDTYADAIHVRKSYMYDELKWGVKFENMMAPLQNTYVLDLSKINETQPGSLNK